MLRQTRLPLNFKAKQCIILAILENMKQPPNLKHLWPKQLICLSGRKLPQILFYSPLIIKFKVLVLINTTQSGGKCSKLGFPPKFETKQCMVSEILDKIWNTPLIWITLDQNNSSVWVEDKSPPPSHLLLH